jgi:hypothetical protein
LVFAVAAKIQDSREEEEMSKNKLVAHHEKCSGVHAELGKGFEALSAHFHKLAEHNAENNPEVSEEYAGLGGKCDKMAGQHAELSEAHGAMAEHAKKALEDRLGKTIVGPFARGVVGDAPESSRVRMVNRVGGAPDQRTHAEKVFGENLDPDVEGIDPELADLVKGA